MDSAPPPSVSVDLLPPPDPATVYRIGLTGLGLSLAAAAVGVLADDVLGGGPDALNTVRLLLVAVGVLTAGAAVSMRSGLWQVWGIAAGAGLLAAVAGLPGHWDSARLLARVLTGLAVAGAALAAMPRGYRYAVLSFAAVFHFGGILTATTWPGEPPPWLTNQVGNRVYMPYLSFLYMRNAYHFYSPEPGPASHVFALVKYDLDETDPKTGKPKTTAEWVTMPDRRQHVRDPLGLGYYRRLSLSEMLNGTVTDAMLPNTAEKESAKKRRGLATLGLDGKEGIPLAPADYEALGLQYRVPLPHVSRYLLPSYARHLAAAHAAPGRRVTGVKLYRLEHRIIQPSAFVAGIDPYYIPFFRPYYLGEYDPAGKLLDPDDPLLYWLVPLLPRADDLTKSDPRRPDFTDYLSKHAGFEVDWRRP